MLAVSFKVLLESRSERFKPTDKIIGSIPDDKPIVDIRHRSPIELCLGDKIEGAPQLRIRILNPSNIVEADIPLVARAVKHMGTTAGDVMAFEHENAFPGVAREEGGARQAADT